MTMSTDELLAELGSYCRDAQIAETTFGRLAVNDGKLISRLRDGGRITSRTLDRLRAYIADHPAEAAEHEPSVVKSNGGDGNRGDIGSGQSGDSRRNFRFFDNRQKYLLFVTTCSEKTVIANRVVLELANLRPRPPALRLFDAGIGDGTVLSRVLRAMRARFPTLPFHVVGKEVSLEDIRLTLEKLSDRFFEHPATVVVLTNMFYSEAPWLRVTSPEAAAALMWQEVSLAGNAAHQFDEQIAALTPFLSENWKATKSPSTGNPIYERPVVLVLYCQDHRFLLDSVIPRFGAARADYDLVIASQPYRLRVPVAFKAKRVIAPLARALGPGGRLIAIHSRGHDPGQEIVQELWPKKVFFPNNRHDILGAIKRELSGGHRDLNFNAYSDKRSIFRYEMHALPDEISGPIGTSTLFAAWNAAIYTAQIEDELLDDVVRTGSYVDATRDVLQKYGGLWFNDESYVISRRRQ